MSAFLVPTSVILGLLLLNIICVAAEFSIISLRPTSIVQIVDQGDPTARRLKRILDEPMRLDRYIATSQLGITIASLSLGLYSQHLTSLWLAEWSVSWLHLNPVAAQALVFLMTVSLLTGIHVVIGEMVPRSLALHNAERTALTVNNLIQPIQVVLSPLSLLLNAIGNGLLRLLHIPSVHTRRRPYSPEELELVVTESHKGGLLSDDEQQIIQNIFALSERRVGQAMTPRPRIAAIAHDIEQDALRTYIASSTYSRFPVYQGDMDHIVGLLLAKDFVRQQLETPDTFDLSALLRHMPAVPEAMTVDRLLTVFKHSHVHMALVFDEYGSTAGVVTLEDVVEEVVGEVRDEFDQNELPYLRELSPGVFLARGDLMLDDLFELAPDTMPDESEEELPDVDTVGGLVVSLLGRPAQPGDQVALHTTLFTVERVSGYAVDMVNIVQRVVGEDAEEHDASTSEGGHF